MFQSHEWHQCGAKKYFRPPFVPSKIFESIFPPLSTKSQTNSVKQDNQAFLVMVAWINRWHGAKEHSRFGADVCSNPRWSLSWRQAFHTFQVKRSLSLPEKHPDYSFLWKRSFRVWIHTDVYTQENTQRLSPNEWKKCCRKSKSPNGRNSSEPILRNQSGGFSEAIHLQMEHDLAVMMHYGNLALLVYLHVLLLWLELNAIWPMLCRFADNVSHRSFAE